MSPEGLSDTEKTAALEERVSTLAHLAKVQRRLLQDAEWRADRWRQEAEEAQQALAAIAAELTEVEETEERSDNGHLDEGLGQDDELLRDAEKVQPLRRPAAHPPVPRGGSPRG
jgi:hypothetical protein